MQTLRPSQVPVYLRSSKFFLGLNVADDDEFSIPSNHMKENMNVDTFAGVTELLNTIRFWGLDVFPEAMIDFVARPSEKVKLILEPFRAELPSICAACRIVGEVAGNKERLEKAMDSGDMDIVKYFHNRGARFSERAIALAAGKGALDCLQYGLIATTAGHYSLRTGNEVYIEAVRKGRMDSILFLQQSGFPLRQHFAPFIPYIEESGEYIDLPKIAASSGQCDVLKYLHSQGCSLSSTAIAAADAGYWNCLEYAIAYGALLRDENTSHSTLPLAQRLARANQLALFPAALSRAGQIDAQTTLNFAKYENWEMFKLCIQYIKQPTFDIVLVVTKQGYVACLQRLHEICLSEGAASNSSGNSISLPRPADLAQAAIKAKQWGCLQFLITHDCFPMNIFLTTVLVKAGQLELYCLAVAHGCEVSVQAACYFARDGNLDFLKHALEHGCDRSEEIMVTAAWHGQLQCMMHAHAQGCPLSAKVLLAAARDGHRECLQYLYEHGCPSNEQVRSVLRNRNILG